MSPVVVRQLWGPLRQNAHFFQDLANRSRVVKKGAGAPPECVKHNTFDDPSFLIDSCMVLHSFFSKSPRNPSETRVTPEPVKYTTVEHSVTDFPHMLRASLYFDNFWATPDRPPLAAVCYINIYIYTYLFIILIIIYITTYYYI